MQKLSRQDDKELKKISPKKVTLCSKEEGINILAEIIINNFLKDFLNDKQRTTQ
jgi:hypothetical protein